MSIKTAYSTKQTAEEAIIEIKNGFAGIHPKMVVFFASSIFDQQDISRGMKETFSNAQVFGCSTAGEIVSGKVLKNSIVAMAFDKDTISDVKVEGIWLAIKLRSKFVAILRHHDGDVGALIRYLRES